MSRPVVWIPIEEILFWKPYLKFTDGAGCILVTHDMSEAKQWCNRIYVMLAGRAIEVLDLSKHEPQHPYALLFDPWGAPLPEKLSKGVPSIATSSIVIQSKCAQELPTLTQIADDHSLSCHALCATSNQSSSQSGESS